MAFTADGRFNFITAQGRHLFKKNTFTVSTLPRARLEPRANIVYCAKPREKQDVGHEGVALVTSEYLAFLHLTHKPLTVGSQDSCYFRDEQDVLVSSVGHRT